METLDQLLKSDSELASLPEIYLRVSELLDNERASARQIGEVVETDPALGTRILKMVNSAYYGFPRQIASISQAISILGRDRLRQILLGSVIGGVFSSFDNAVFSLHSFWRDSVKTALLARYMARASNQSELAETLFTAGLLHDIGGLILAHKLPQQALQVRSATQYENEDLCMAENRIFGFTHCDTGAAFITHWELPEILADAARFHHNPYQAGDNAQVLELIYIADSLAFFDEVIEQDEITNVLDRLSGWETLGLDVDSITDACVLAERQVFEVMDALGMNQLVIAET
jgi:HD-like signal output (HDOD) protein